MNKEDLKQYKMHPQRVEERVEVSCYTCKWQYAKYEYKCEACCAGDSQWEQDTDC